MKVFLSYSTKDMDIAQMIKEELKLLGVEVYLAEEDPQPGRILAEKIKKELRNSDLVIALITPNSLQSTYVWSEIGGAALADKPIIPLVHPSVPETKLAFLTGKEYISCLLYTSPSPRD